MIRSSIVAVAFLCWLGNSAALRAEEPLFSRQIAPLLYRLGCSAGACHGSFAGKGGFRLSLFAGNVEADYANVRGIFGRRVDPLHPEQSLLLLKPTGAIEHGGGVKLKAGGEEYQLIKAWIESGARFDVAKEAAAVAVRVGPPALTVSSGKQTGPLRVFAKYSDGKEADVTRFAKFESLNPGLADVDANGRITGVRSGDVSILAHYAGQIGFTGVLVPGPTPKIAFPAEQPKDKVDQLLLARLKQLNIVPSAQCSDLEFLRRAYLDSIGQLPTPEEIRLFLADGATDKRGKLIDKLLEHPLHAAVWAGKMCDMVGADDRFLGDGVYSFHDWFRNKFEQNLPWDKIAHGVLCATKADGRSPDQIKEDQKREAEERKKKQADPKAKAEADPTKKLWQTGYATRNTLDVFYDNLINRKDTPDKKRLIDSPKIALRVAHTFLGVRLECAQCHKHPHDRWSQQDFLSFAAVFAHVDFGVDPELKAQKVNLAGTHCSSRPVETFTDPDTGAPLPARILAGPKVEVKPGGDVREDVWKWMLTPENPFFAQAMVNRVWEHYLGRGFTDPADAQSAANPPSHPEVLDELVKDFIANKYDLRHLERRVMNTLAYQRDWQTNETNAHDERNFSHRQLRRLTAEQALDAIAQVTGTDIKLPKRYGSFREGVKAAEIALSRVGGDDGYVLQIFGKPLRTQNCDCERSGAASLSQTMYLYNDEKLIAKIAEPKGRLQKLVKDVADDRKLIEELYLLALTRLPTQAEVNRSLDYMRTARSRPEAYQDLLWSLMNRNEFVVNH